MALPPERSSSREPLHNFTLPSHLKWGSQKHLRCAKLNTKGNKKSVADQKSSSSETEPTRAGKNELITGRRSSADRKPPLQSIGADSDDIEEVRKKLTLQLRVAADEMKNSILEEKSKEKEKEKENGKEAEESNYPRPWKLRVRRASSKVPQDNFYGGGGKGVLNCNSPSPGRFPESQSSRLRGGMGSPRNLNEERPKFSLTLTKEEIESDFMAMLGTKPPRRPKKRPKPLQRQLNALFPGSWLREAAAETYEVPEVPESGKSGKGLK